MKNKQDINKLLLACRNGNSAAQKDLYVRFFSMGLNLCLRYAEDRDEAKEMLNTGFLQAFKKIDQYRGEGSFEGWLRRVLINSAISFLRKKKKYHLYEMPESDIPDTGHEPVHADLQYADALNLVQQLSPVYRTVFNLYVIEGFSHAEIAEQLNISVGTSKSNLSRAKKKLQILFAAEYPERVIHK